MFITSFEEQNITYRSCSNLRIHLSPDLNALLEENKKLKQQLKTAEMEREFLKKAAAYFAKESQ